MWSLCLPYARQFLQQLERPDVETIEGLSPAIAIDQKGTVRNPRSTVGTVTEVYDFLRLLYARVGTAHCPRCDRPVSPQSTPEIYDRVSRLGSGSRLQILAPIVSGRKGSYRVELRRLARSGYVRARIDGRIRDLDDAIELDRHQRHDIEVVVDRVVLRDGLGPRLRESLETALRLGDGVVIVNVVGDRDHLFSRRSACLRCGISVPELEPRSFSFNSPRGACAHCEGLGTVSSFDPERIVADPGLSLPRGAIGPWQGKAYPKRFFTALCKKLSVAPETPWKELPAKTRRLVLHGLGDGGVLQLRLRGGGALDRHLATGFTGVIPALEAIYEESQADRVTRQLEPYLTATPCPKCQGQRLRPESLAVRVGGLSIAALTASSIDDTGAALDRLRVPPRLAPIAGPLLKELAERLSFLQQVGLGYLTLDRSARSLAGGESQRIRLATQIGTRLRGVLYVLDEPSIGLHARDNKRLIEALLAIRDLGNTVVVVEHDEQTIRAADWVLDLGPGAGEHGGRLVAVGPPDGIAADPLSPTGAYLAGRRRIEVPARRRDPVARTDAGVTHLTIRGVRHHNLKNITVSLPIGCMTVVTGVSGSGKSSLVEETLYRALAQRLYDASAIPGEHAAIEGAESIDKVIDVTQEAIGRTPRSNPATYTGAFTPIRQVFSALPDSKVRGYSASRFPSTLPVAVARNAKAGG